MCFEVNKSHFYFYYLKCIFKKYPLFSSNFPIAVTLTKIICRYLCDFNFGIKYDIRIEKRFPWKL